MVVVITVKLVVGQSYLFTRPKVENSSVIKLVALEGKMSVTVLAARSVKRWKRLKSFLATDGYPKSCTLRLALMM
ncbi:hypothetical protein [Candidatus Enterovibrio escicola]|uniref:hypothetical protein n=1 Tax=Candidatus Enterovibrio escicola TaxID=1927127 RepID=UPI0030DB04B2